jgi:hypothetical protein
MSRFIAVVSAAAVAIIVLASTASFMPAVAADAAAVKQAKANCKAEVKEHARYNEMSWWAQHKAVQKCVKDALAGH